MKLVITPKSVLFAAALGFGVGFALYVFTSRAAVSLWLTVSVTALAAGRAAYIPLRWSRTFQGTILFHLLLVAVLIVDILIALQIAGFYRFR